MGYLPLASRNVACFESISSEIYRLAASSGDHVHDEHLNDFMNKSIFLVVYRHFEQYKLLLSFFEEIYFLLSSFYSSSSASVERPKRERVRASCPPALPKPVPPGNRTTKRSNYPKSVTDILKNWIQKHVCHPYPSEEQKEQLSRETGLCLTQINNWFINARRRLLPNLVTTS